MAIKQTKDEKRLISLKGILKKMRKKSAQEKLDILETQRVKLLDELASGDKVERNSAKNREKAIVNVLKSDRFQKDFYKLSNVTLPPTIFEVVKHFFETLWKKITTLFHKKNKFEKIMDRMAMIEELSILEKKVRLTKHGINADFSREDDETDDGLSKILERIENDPKSKDMIVLISTMPKK